jgi:hypothetical protein
MNDQVSWCYSIALSLSGYYILPVSSPTSTVSTYSQKSMATTMENAGFKVTNSSDLFLKHRRAAGNSIIVLDSTSWRAKLELQARRDDVKYTAPVQREEIETDIKRHLASQRPLSMHQRRLHRAHR